AGVKVRQLGGADSRFAVLAFAPDGRGLAAGQRNDGVRLWEVATGQERAAFADLNQPGDAPRPRPLACSPDGRALAAVTHDVRVKVRDAVTGVEHGQLPGHRDTVSALAFAGPGTLVSGSRDTTALVW